MKKSKLRRMQKASRKTLRQRLRERFSFTKWLDPFTYSDIFLERTGLIKNQLASWSVYLVTAFLSAYLLYALLGVLFHSPSPMVIVVSGSMEPAFYRGDVMVLSGWGIEDLKAPLVEMPGQSIQGVDVGKYAETLCSVKGVQGLYPCRALSRDLAVGKLKREDVVVKKIQFTAVNKEIPVTKKGDVVVYWSESQGIPVIHRAVAKIRASDGLFVLTKGDSKLNPFIDQDTALSYGAVRVDSLHGRVVFMVPWIGYVKLILLDDLPCYLTSPFTGAKCQFP